MATSLAETTRGKNVESVHLGNVAVVDANGTLVAWSGDPDTHVYFRSSAKVFQALPLVFTGAADAYGFTTAELAMACASHNGTSHHQAIVSSMLNKIGLSERDLRCGFSTPVDDVERARITLGLTEPSQLACECSGEHAAMLATCRHVGWKTENYTEPNHPLQRFITAIMVAVCDVRPSALALAVDGCSIPTFGAPLHAFARAYAVLADPDEACWPGRPEWRAALHRLRKAIVLHPDLIAGDGEIDTTILQVTDGSVVAKLGAEGLLCLSVPEQRLGIAISDIAGTSRGLGPAAVAVLGDMDVLDTKTLDCLRAKLCPPLKTFTGVPVGVTRPTLRLESPLPVDRDRVGATPG